MHVSWQGYHADNLELLFLQTEEKASALRAGLEIYSFDWTTERIKKIGDVSDLKCKSPLYKNLNLLIRYTKRAGPKRQLVSEHVV